MPATERESESVTVYLLQATGPHRVPWGGRGSRRMRKGCSDCCHCEGWKIRLETGSGSQALPPRPLSSSQAAAEGGPRLPRGSDSRGPAWPPAGCAPGRRSPTTTTRTSPRCLSPDGPPNLHPGLSEPPGVSCRHWECWGRGEMRAGGDTGSSGSLEFGHATPGEEWSCRREIGWRRGRKTCTGPYNQYLCKYVEPDEDKHFNSSVKDIQMWTFYIILATIYCAYDATALTSHSVVWTPETERMSVPVCVRQGADVRWYRAHGAKDPLTGSGGDRHLGSEQLSLCGAAGVVHTVQETPGIWWRDARERLANTQILCSIKYNHCIHNY